ncbi:iron-sulfur cluster assembly scaffold protein [Dichotomicrobium thermohalophilum]|uniref:NifU-like protein involved in Fe-S cluster formation n=1 Tax=Dichotomicrobium thermohalophilum TaxID=933063 RepID=A0A397Q1Y2_9HYPH|nr:iron-sulfur cluster assembly scaffold protein [Dichotomicrobium thermohalophilum]RIA55500.1 NifU-like protein involved in Fe-S cluster formation [Dichotomicrobium thermohalophilum]
MTDLEDIYADKLLALAAAISRTDRLTAPDASASAHSKLCGSTVAVDACFEDGRITDFGQEVKACLLGQATASVVAREIVGTPIEEFREVAAQMREMLKAGGEPPGGRWADLSLLEPVRDYRARHASTLLVFDALEEAIDKYEAGKTDAPAAAAGQ